jgi:hypothetical protein
MAGIFDIGIKSASLLPHIIKKKIGALVINIITNAEFRRYCFACSYSVDPGLIYSVNESR